MTPFFHKEIRPEKFGLTKENFLFPDEKTIIVSNKNWDYSMAHDFQRFAVNSVLEGQNLKVLICCSHPKILTNGRGLQKPKKGETLDLIDFHKEQYPELPYPLFQIERGGGLTFHHPGQFIFYPILKLNPKTLSLSKMINSIFETSIAVLKNWGVENLSHENKLLGLWHFDKKIASMGVAIEKLATFHGMALNLENNTEILSAISDLNPCGLKSDTYSSIDQIIKLPENAWEKFKSDFINRIYNEWK